ncbi:TPA: hypothetical protein N0F65_005265 [Lagenidium giganteum]|uniref:Protein phosphatase 1 regulatory subunit 22 n=1 Tax=Lagenidium giganteum TaxID=4803 RepID=A0AAV2YW88_9STRA|nr:TPA: hypothetical protein N0F65_005265 [Lagenidium giganteum]
MSAHESDALPLLVPLNANTASAAGTANGGAGAGSGGSNGLSIPKRDLMAHHVNSKLQTAPTDDDDSSKAPLVPTNNTDLPSAQREKLLLFEANSELQELCRDNGITGSTFSKKAHTVTSLDMFLGFWGSMKSVQSFSALRELSITKHPTIVAIEGVDGCPHLELLSITECCLERIDNLQHCTKLRRLNLSSNKIRKIENLDNLVQLETLWLNDNQIDKIEGLWKLSKLKVLWLCRNRIERIDSALNGNVSLTELNLADNRLCSFKSLLSLTNLDQLSTLTLSDPHFGENPVCRLCNYQTYLMCQLARLTMLDTVELSARNKQIAEATMIKKKMYYNMRIKAIKRDIRHRMKHTESIRNLAEQHIELNLGVLIRQKKDIERFLATQCHKQTSALDDNSQLILDMRKKLECVEACMKDRFGAVHRMGREFDNLRTTLQWTADISITRLMLELETGGNIRLEDGKPTDAWFASCVDLVKSRFFQSDLKNFGIQDVRINRVTRINNRYLRNRFHTRMEEILVVPEQQIKDNVSKKGVTVPVKDPEDKDSTSFSKESDRASPSVLTPLDLSNQYAATTSVPGAVLENSLEYLFYVQPPLLDHTSRTSDIEQFFVAENGFRDANDYRSMGVDGAIKLSNSLALLDAPRIAAALSAKGLHIQKRDISSQDLIRYSTMSLPQQLVDMKKDLTWEMKSALKLVSTGEWEIPGGVLLVVKVFPGLTKYVVDNEVLPTPVDARKYPGLQSLQAARGLSNPSDGTKQKVYYLFDKALVLPEYLVEYQYVSSESSVSSAITGIAPLTMSTAQPSSSEPTVPDPALDPPRAGDDEAIDLGLVTKLADEFERKYRVRKSQGANGDGLMSPTSAAAASFRLTYDENVTRALQMEPTVPATSESEVEISPQPAVKVKVDASRIKYLNLINCELESIPDLSQVAEYLEVLVLSYNKLHRLDLTRPLPKLQSIDLSYNHIRRVDYLDYMPSITAIELNHNQLFAFEDIEYLGRIRGGHLRHVDLRKNPLCDTKRYRIHVLQYLSNLDTLDQQRVSREEYVAAKRLITKLSAAKIWEYVRGRKLSSGGVATGESSDTTSNQLSCKPELDEDDAQSASNIAKRSWTTIEELCLNRELVSVIEGLEYMTSLRSISLCDNIIKRIDGFKACSRLEELSLEDNEIARIENLESLVFLKKLNLGRNRLTSIENLESLDNLTQLSLEENQITSLRGLGNAHKLMELYIGSNKIESLKEIQHLKSLPKLTILDLSGNEITRLVDYRLYSVYYLRRVKVLDGVSISPQDQSDAKQKYSGKLTTEFIAEKCGNAFDRIQEMNLSSCRIREIGSITGKVFPNMRELNLENNQISDISGLEALPRLRVLNLTRNRIERLMPAGSGATFSPPDGHEGRGVLACLKLEQLFLGYNQISDMSVLGFQFLDELKVLSLEGNSIVFFAGLESNLELRELRLDRNKIRQLDAHSTLALSQLRLLSMEENGLKSLSNFNNLVRLETLDLSNNRILELEEVDKLTSAPTLLDLRLANNPVTKKHMYRQTVAFRLTALKTLDGKEITADERERIEIFFSHERAAAAMSGSLTDRLLADMRNINTHQSALLSLTPTAVPGKQQASSLMQTTSIPISASAGKNASAQIASQSSSNDVFSGSVLRKNPMASTSLPAAPQSNSAYAKGGDQTADISIGITPSSGNGSNNTKTRFAPVQPQQQQSQQHIFRSNPLSNQSSVQLGPGAVSSSFSSATATVASAFGALSGGSSSDHFHLGSLRSDRRRMSSVHFDQTLTTGSNEQVKLPSGLVSTHAVIRGPTSIMGQGVIIHPSSADATKPLPAGGSNGSATMPPPSLASDSTRSFTGYVVSYANQKRYPSFQDLQTEPTPSQFGTTRFPSANVHNRSR